jgi:O-antigen/teichoic acid export membrane protein
VSTRALGAGDAAAVAVLWTCWSFAAAALTFPLQHWITQAAAADGGTAGVRRALPRVALVSGSASVLAGVVGYLLRDPLFHRDDALFPAMVVGVMAGSALTGVVRGGLSARRRFVDVAGTLVAENALRCVAVFVLLGAGIDSPVAYGLCIVAGNVTCLLWPAGLRFADTGQPHRQGSALGFLVGASLGQTLGQVVLTGGPVVLAICGGSPADVTILFAGLALFRAPYTLAIGVVAQLTGRLTGLVVERRTRELQRIRLLVIAATGTVGVAGAVLGAWLGPWLVQLVFGPDVTLDGTGSALLAVASTFAVSNLLMTIAVIAHGRPGATSAAWVLGMLAAVPLLATGIEPLHRVATAFLVAEAVAWLTLLAADLYAVRRLVRR